MFDVASLNLHKVDAVYTLAVLVHLKQGEFVILKLALSQLSKVLCYNAPIKPGFQTEYANLLNKTEYAKNY